MPGIGHLTGDRFPRPRVGRSPSTTKIERGGRIRIRGFLVGQFLLKSCRKAAAATGKNGQAWVRAHLPQVPDCVATTASVADSGPTLEGEDSPWGGRNATRTVGRVRGTAHPPTRRDDPHHPVLIGVDVHPLREFAGNRDLQDSGMAGGWAGVTANEVGHSTTGRLTGELPWSKCERTPQEAAAVAASWGCASDMPATMATGRRPDAMTQ